VRRLDRAVRHGLDARRQTNEHAPHARSGRCFGLARRVEDDERAGLRGRPQLLLRLVVAVEHEPLAGDPRRPRERELAERRDIGAGSLPREQPQQRDVRESLRPVDDERAGRGLAVRLHLAPDCALAVHEERRAMPVCQLAGANTAQRELAVLDQRGFGK
jgi:hypothetical protein